MPNPIAWHIDGWDARGGRAFASLRENGSDLSMAASEATIFVGPPAFQPELITNTSIALAASRNGVYDPRVPANGREFSFPSASAVAEFARRGFVSGGGNRGGGFPAETTPEIIDEGGGPARERANPLREYIFAFGKMGLGEHEAAKVEIPLHSFRNEPDDPIVCGAARIAAALISAAPRGRSSQGSAPAWLDASHAFVMVLSELHIVPDLLDSGSPNAYARGLIDQALNKQNLPSLEAVLDYWDDTRFWHHIARRFDWPFPFLGLHHNRNNDRYGPLFSWPLPTAKRSRNSDDPKTVGQLLTRFVSSPVQFEKMPEAWLDTVLFAAAALNANCMDKTDAKWRSAAATQWLSSALPQWRFSKKAEESIQGAWKLQAVEAASMA